jgi:uncharacterized membrane protein
MKYLSPIALLFLIACGGEKVEPAENHFAGAEAYATWVDETVGSKLAWRSNSSIVKGDTEWAGWVGYVNGKPAMVRLYGQGDNNSKWWIYPDSATGKVLFFKEEVQREGKTVRNRFAYRGDSLGLGMALNDPYVSTDDGRDFRVKFADVQALYDETVQAVEADVKYLSPAANEARKENAQFFATGGEKSWSVTINPSISAVTLKQPGAEDRKFGYDVPTTGPKNESIYIFNSLNGKIQVSIFSKECGSSDGRNYPYTVVVEDAGKSLAGCGVLLQ